MLKILQARLQQYVNRELPDVQAGFRKDRGTRGHIANIHWITEKTESSGKTSTSALLTMPKPLIVWIITKWKILKETEMPDHLICLLKNLYAVQEATVRTSRGTTDLVPNWERSSSKLYTVNPACLAYMQSTSCEMPSWIKHKVESRLLGEISITSDVQMTPHLWQKVKKSLLMKVKEENEKVDKTKHSEN